MLQELKLISGSSVEQIEAACDDPSKGARPKVRDTLYIMLRQTRKELTLTTIILGSKDPEITVHSRGRWSFRASSVLFGRGGAIFGREGAQRGQGTHGAEGRNLYHLILFNMS